MATVSIVLPTYNRAKFLPAAFDAIGSQTYSDWNLTVIDDGSTDDSRSIIEEYEAKTDQKVTYLYQDNAGPSLARQRGVDASRGEYIAFFDSDDIWLPHHLEDCIRALEDNCEVDWVAGDLARIDKESGRVLVESKFDAPECSYEFLNLNSIQNGKLYMIDDDRLVETLISDGGGFGALQTSVLRRSVFERVRLPNLRIGEDRAFVIECAIKGCRLAYIRDIHVHFMVHGDHTASVRKDLAFEEVAAKAEDLLRSYCYILNELPLDATCRKLVRKRMAAESFWAVGYAGMWMRGERRLAMKYFRKGLRYWPWSLGQWKTYTLCLIRRTLHF